MSTLITSLNDIIFHVPGVGVVFENVFEQGGDSSWPLSEKEVIFLWELMGASCVSGLGYG